MSIPVISVALCTYNSSRFVEIQLRSILSQSILPFEIVISDDGSTDDTLNIVRVVCSKVPSVRLRVITGTESLGVTANFERAVRACVGDLIVLCDHDDYWQPRRIETALQGFSDDEHLLFQHTDARLIDEVGAPLGVSLFQALGVSPAERELIDSGHAFSAYLRRNVATGATAMFRRSLLESALPFPKEWVHDEWLAVVASIVGRVQVLDDQLIDYRQHGRNQIGVKKPTLRYRVGRMLEPRGRRYEELALRSRRLLERLPDLNPSESVLLLVRRKVNFEADRSRLPRNRLARVSRVWHHYRAGSYATLSSQGDLDVVRDLIQPA